MQQVDIKLMGLSGEIGIVVIGSLSMWLIHKGFIQVLTLYFNDDNIIGLHPIIII